MDSTCYHDIFTDATPVAYKRRSARIQSIKEDARQLHSKAKANVKNYKVSKYKSKYNCDRSQMFCGTLTTLIFLIF